MSKSELQELEEKLLTVGVRGSRSELGALVADDFMEFGSSGRTWTKTEVLEELPLQKPLGDAEISEFETSTLGVEHALVRYHLDIEGSKSLRSSIWRKRDDRWEVIFHQGTRSE